MRKKLLFTTFSTLAFIICTAQKKNYIGFESGAYFGNANSQIESGMISSGFDDKESTSFWGIFNFNTEYPIKNAGKTSYRVKYGHNLNKNTAIEAGFGLSYHGTVKGHDDRDFGQSNYLTLTSNINTLYFAWVKKDSLSKTGFGVGPTVSFYKLSADINQGASGETTNYVLPGVMIKGFWNFLSFPSWFIGVGTELSVTAAAKIKAIKITTSSSESTFKSTKAGSFNGNFFLTAGFKF